jgi:GNAT superfamily N-acetyltransferase
MTIRSLKPEDFPAWLSLWESYNSFYKRAVTMEVTEQTWKRFLDHNEPMYALVAEAEGKVVGFTTYLFHRHTAMISEVCYLQDLFTDEKFRGQGIGKSLISAVSVRAKENGSIQVYWMTHESNEVARSLYDKLAKHSGFIVYSKRA